MLEERRIGREHASPSWTRQTLRMGCERGHPRSEFNLFVKRAQRLIVKAVRRKALMGCGDSKRARLGTSLRKAAYSQLNVSPVRVSVLRSECVCFDVA